MKQKDFIEIHDYAAEEVLAMFELARDIKTKPKKFRDALEGQTLAMSSVR
jgi:ornithine carbamoyltransferase